MINLLLLRLKMSKQCINAIASIAKEINKHDLWLNEHVKQHNNCHGILTILALYIYHDIVINITLA